ncbi:MAG TPA: IS30 family transposase [Nitrospira sp.]|nr:IS30 family transposase [Nitrospira sp.]
MDGQPRGQIIDGLSIRHRPADVDDRAIPGHWEGDLIADSKNTHIATLVEQQSRFTMLVKVPGKDTTSVVTALSQHVCTLPSALRRSLTWDRGMELAQHKRLTVDTEVRVYFCDPQSPWQRGTNENTNRLLCQYLPKGTDLSRYSQANLNTIALRLNQRPRKTLGFQTPAAILEAAVATTAEPTIYSLTDPPHRQDPSLCTPCVSIHARSLGGLGIQPCLGDDGFRLEPIFQVMSVTASAFLPELVSLDRDAFAPVFRPHHEFLSRLATCRRRYAFSGRSRSGRRRDHSRTDYLLRFRRRYHRAHLLLGPITGTDVLSPGNRLRFPLFHVSAWQGEELLQERDASSSRLAPHQQHPLQLSSQTSHAVSGTKARQVTERRRNAHG